MGVAAEKFHSDVTSLATEHFPSHEAQRLLLERGCNAWARALLNEMELAGAVERALDQLLSASCQDRLALFQVQTVNAPHDLRVDWVAEVARAGLSQSNRGLGKTQAAGRLPETLAIALCAGRAFIAGEGLWPGNLVDLCRFAPKGSLLIVPIHAFGKLWGGLWLECAASFPWEESAIHTLGTAADLFAAHLERKQAIQARAERNKLAGALEMAGAVCHKLNQPMQIILGYSSMVTSGDIIDPEQVREIVQMIEGETRRMGIITKNLMGITRYRTVTDPEGGTIYDIDAPEPSV